MVERERHRERMSRREEALDHQQLSGMTRLRSEHGTCNKVEGDGGRVSGRTADDAANDGARVVVVVLLLDARGDGHEGRGPVA